MATWTLELRDDLFALRHPEDSSEYTASVFYVIATDYETGRRYAHDHLFKTAHVYEETDEDGYFSGIADTKWLDQPKAERFLAKVQAAQAAGKFTTPVGRPHWTEMDPVYGTARYEQLEPEIVAWEKSRDEFDLF